MAGRLDRYGGRGVPRNNFATRLSNYRDHGPAMNRAPQTSRDVAAAFLSRRLPVSNPEALGRIREARQRQTQLDLV